VSTCHLWLGHSESSMYHSRLCPRCHKNERTRIAVCRHRVPVPAHSSPRPRLRTSLAGPSPCRRIRYVRAFHRSTVSLRIGRNDKAHTISRLEGSAGFPGHRLAISVRPNRLDSQRDAAVYQVGPVPSDFDVHFTHAAFFRRPLTNIRR
jgi:hypothetical protein